MKLKTILLASATPAIALGLGLALLSPGTSQGFGLIGGSLSQNQRDFRVFNNFTDTLANNNTTPHASFPGYTGAVMAIWKATVEWGSELHGDGSGDPHQNNGLGSGGANFDPSFQGEATGIGGTNSNIHSEILGSQNGVLAFTETPISDGWRIRYYSFWSWADGPGTNVGFNNVDLQGVATHEFGHSLGIGHSPFGGATMAASISGSGVAQRSLAPDDINDVQLVYGVKAGNKPRITGTSVSGNTITITGQNFNTSGNQVWFTQAGQGGTGLPIKVTNLTSNGTTITANIPAAAGPGDVLVRRNSTAHSGLSNAWPADLVSGGGGPPGGGAPQVSSVSPSSVPAINVDDVAQVTLNGSSFLGTTSMTVDGVALSTFPADFTVVNDNVITFTMPVVSKLGIVAISLTNASGTGNSIINVIANPTPTVELANSNPSFLIQALGIEITVAGNPGDIAFLAISPQLIPTALPGLVDVPLAIGNNLASLIILGAPVIGPAGHTTLNIALAGLAPGTALHVQSAHAFLSTSFALPTTASNTQSGIVLF